MKPDEPIIGWLIIHSAETINRFAIGQDGKTSYERWKGKKYQVRMAEFGERVLSLKPGSTGKKSLTRGGKMGCGWELTKHLGSTRY